MNHFLFSVSNLESYIAFYQNVFDAKLLVKGRNTAYFDFNGLWLAQNVEKDIPRNEISQSYTHIAFSIEEADFMNMYEKLNELIYLLLGIGSIIDGFESFLKKENNRQMLLYFGIVAFIWWFGTFFMELRVH